MGIRILALVALLVLGPTQATQLTLTGAGRAGSHPSATTTLDPANTGAPISLSNGNLTATTNGSDGAISRSIASHSTGKYYREITITSATYVLDAVGLNGGETLTGQFIGQSGGIGYLGQLTPPNIYTGDAPVASIPDWANTNVVSEATDLTNGNVYWRVNCGNWNNSGTANPATNTGGITTSGVTLPVYAAVGLGATAGENMTVNFGATAYSCTPPSGFGNW
jgi:hypothetical protein